MNSERYEILKQLIDLYAQYEGGEKSPDIFSFIQWVGNKYDSEPETLKTKEREHYSQHGASEIPVYKSLELRSRFLENIAALSRYHEFYTKKALKDIEINSRMEYLFLQTVENMQQAKKTDLINVLQIEYTTGMDTIRRLLNNDLLSETTNENDKRSRLLQLTDKGEKVLSLANKNMADEACLFLATTSDNKWKKVLLVLEEMNDFHRFVYENHSDKPFAEISNMIDSLKYLHKS